MRVKSTCEQRIKSCTRETALFIYCLAQEFESEVVALNATDRKSTDASKHFIWGESCRDAQDESWVRRRLIVMSITKRISHPHQRTVDEDGE